ncbi:MAG TPA: sigma factor [Gallionella sp.]|nr:sigma factor [Gallionella sp.]
MTGTAHSEQELLPGLEQTGCSRETVTAGTYALRRTHYFNDAEQASPTSNEPRQVSENPSDADDFDAEQRSLIQHLHMVTSIARQYANRGVEDVELVKAGNHGLIHALEHYNPDKDADFSNYAAMCIRQHVEYLITDRRGHLKVAQTGPQYAASRHRNAPSVSAQPQGIYVIRAFIENRIHERRHPHHPEFPPEFGGLHD